jgi:hypothetical protein
MLKSRRLVVALAVSGLLAAGGITFGLVANANTQQFCDSSGTPSSCTISDQTIPNPSAITLVIILKSGTSDTVTFTWSGDCSLGTTVDTFNQGTTDPTATVTNTTQASVNMTLPIMDPDSCDITAATATFGSSSTDAFEMEMEYTPASTVTATATATATSTSTSPPPVTVSLVKGYKGMCLDDPGNSSANKTKVIIWKCNSHDSAQGWTYSSGELKHNGKCANVQGGRGSGSKLILWSCNGASNEKWFHSSTDGEFVLSSQTHGLICLDDPGYSTTDRTQLIVYSCKNSSNQHWSLT